jgi:GrpB-like predicted nucleotidyltransferase (UPF0157 family)
MVELRSDFWEKHILFRDYLRTHSKIAQEYYQLKKRLAIQFVADGEAYTQAKAKFIESVITKARADKTTDS